jgi:Outer membrane protein and related peptidoglycan-associated (lipo)proteins
VDFLRGPVAAGKTVYLVGFADSRGSFEYNLDLSVRRARTVATALSFFGVPIGREQIIGASWLAPVACETSEDGLYFNRRVEVWLSDAPAASVIQRGTLGLGLISN